MKEIKTDILIVGGGLGGCAAAWAACEAGRRVIMTEPTAWIGGQMTQQAVPPDENPYVDTCAGTHRYRRFRAAIRRYYHDHYPLTNAARQTLHLNPGNGYVCGLCHEFRISLAVLEAFLAPHRSSGRLRIFHHTTPVGADVQGDRVQAVRFLNREHGHELTVQAGYFLEASELGDLLPLTGTEFVTGFESRAMTGEPSAPEEYQPDNMQAISWCFAMDHREGENHVIDKPEQYDFWRQFTPELEPPWGGPFLSWNVSAARTHQRIEIPFRPLAADAPPEKGPNLWRFRRITHAANFEPGFYEGDITLVNWPQIDYFLGPIINVTEAQAQEHLRNARQLSLSMLYWMQTEAPRHDGKGQGYPGLRLRSDITGDGPDGLALHAYIRESRRIKAQFTVCEHHVSRAIRGDRGAEQFEDSVGTGYYGIDLHPSTGGDNYFDVLACPFQIPLGSLVPQRMENLLAAGKSLGVTHITNGCYRLHPTEWNVGESAGLLAVFCLDRGKAPQQITANETLRREFQDLVRSQGIPMQWHRIY